jgi:cob(I)alamin adenosyltransferase
MFRSIRATEKQNHRRDRHNDARARRGQKGAVFTVYEGKKLQRTRHPAGISPNLTLETFGKPFFVAKPGSAWAEELKKMGGDYMIFEPGNPPQEYLDLVAKGVEKAKKAVSSGDYDLVVLDEINCALFFGLIKWEDLLDLIDSKAENTELILTGRGATPELIERADLVTEMREIKHYYMQGVQARKGIEN